MLPLDVYREAYGLGVVALPDALTARVPAEAALVVMKSLAGHTILSTSPYLTDTEDLPTDPDAIRAYKAYALEACASLKPDYALIKTRNPAFAEMLLPEFTLSHQFVASRLDLSGGEETVWDKRLHTKRRKQVRKGAELQPRFEFGRAANLLDDFYSVFVATQTDLGTPAHGKAYFEGIFRHDPNARVVVGYVGGRPVTGALLLVRERPQGRTLYHPYTGTLREYFSTYLNATLYWEIIKHAIQSGCAWFDMGRSFRGSGVHDFKTYWGTEDVDLVYAYWLKPGVALPAFDTPTLKLATRVWSFLPKALARRLGPRLIKAVP